MKNDKFLGKIIYLQNRPWRIESTAIFQGRHFALLVWRNTLGKVERKTAIELSPTGGCNCYVNSLAVEDLCLIGSTSKFIDYL